MPTPIDPELNEKIKNGSVVSLTEMWALAQLRQAEADAAIAEASTMPLPGHGSINEGSKSQWYANGVRDAATRIRQAAGAPEPVIEQTPAVPEPAKTPLEAFIDRVGKRLGNHKLTPEENAEWDALTTPPVVVIETNIWTAELAARSGLGSSGVADDGIQAIHDFTQEHFVAGADLVVLYNDTDWHLGQSLFRGWGPDQWNQLDSDDGADFNRPYKWSDLGVIMFRDKMTGFAAIKLADAKPAKIHDLHNARRGSIATVLDQKSDNPSVLWNIGGAWINAEEGVDESYSTLELVQWFPSIALAWSAPETDK
jgi:hypothetical protein